jgi:toxin ParE1/3/4
MTYRLAPAARADLRSTWRYTAETWTEARADRYIEAIEQTCADLANGRVPGRPADQYRPGYRSARPGSHLISSLTSQTSRIDVIRILHQRMDLPAHLSEQP